MHMIRNADASVHHSHAEARRYYVPSRDPIEVIETTLRPGASQSAHAHVTVREAVMVLEGQIFAAEIISGKTFGELLKAGDFAVFDPRTLHFMENRTEVPARTLHFKFLGNSKDRTLFLTDKAEGEAVNSSPNLFMPDESRFKSYVDTYNNLDKILWQMPALLLAITAVAFGLFKDVFLDPTKAVEPLTHPQTIGVFSFVLGLMYVAGVYSIWRIRKHHTMMGLEILKLDLEDGYFHKRAKVVSRWWWPPSDTLIFGALFAVLGLLLFGFSGRQFGWW